ncbi:unnamed protein product [Arctia plantaginis]|uniref:Uncharacterized protein n=1 Tax=Arctia plantaginis TaxID=874455 RepID=A0A8S1B7S7_ARCPL|nr:unnamed protein product [Arctia plantaginis]
MTLDNASLRGKLIRKRTHPDSPRGEDLGSDSASSDEVVPAAKVTTARRGRGRPPTSGRYVGLSVARRELAAAQKANRSSEHLEVLVTRTSSEETGRLQAENSRLSAESAQLRKELEELRAELGRLQVRRQIEVEVSPFQRPAQESEVACLLRQELANLNQRFTVLEGKILRPPLASDKRIKPTYAESAASPSQEKTVEMVTRMSASQPASSIRMTKASEKGKVKKTTARGAGNLRPNISTASGTEKAVPTTSVSQPKQPAGSREGEWETAGAKKKAEKRRRNKRKKAARDTRRLRAPRSTAVVITLPSEAEERGLSYAKVLAKAKAEIKLADIDVFYVQAHAA